MLRRAFAPLHVKYSGLLQAGHIDHPGVADDAWLRLAVAGEQHHRAIRYVLAAGRFQMDKCALADITGIIGPHDGAACRNDALRGFRKLHIFAKRSTIEGDIGATIRRNVRYDGVTTIVGGDGCLLYTSPSPRDA